MRKSLLFGGAVLLIALTSFSSGAQEAEVRELSLEESIAIGLENNLDLAQAGYDLSLRETEYQEAKINNLLRTSVVTLKNAELTFKRARDTFEEKKRQLALAEITNRYFEVLKYERKVQIEKISVEQSEENLEVVKNKFSLGDASELDVMQAEVGLSQAQLGFARAENDLTLARMDFNYVLGLALDLPVKLTDTFSLETLEMSLEESIQQALENRYEIIQARDSLEFAKLKLTLKQNQYTSEIEQKKAEIELKKKEVGLEQLMEKIPLEITGSFLGLKEKETNAEITKKQAEEKEESYRIAQAQYKAGLITTADLLESGIKLTQANINALEALFSANLARRQFIKALGGELEKTQQAPS
ncbi:TolC family protein [Candidatus Aerophobetes bacterium]|uniref:TolC family protein n=1 Tax=Aerophobetes bacterium TaxID=2030807 RepID=A0A523UNH1_UNCAE|nr:MAG: TolC family protein [Candidatus Aerophobetes bacterium]